MAIYGYLFLAIALITGGASAVAYKKGSTAAEQRAAVVMSQHIAADATAFAEATRKAHETEVLLTIAQLEVSQAYEKGREDAEVQGKRVADDLRSGALRLQQRWAGCETQLLSTASAAASQPDAAGWDRSESAGRIVRAAKQCDAQVEGLQQLLKTEREQMSKPDSSSRR